jgi:hypothetical protein
MSEPIRAEVASFLAIAPLPASDNADQEHLELLTDLLLKISAPVSREEAICLATAFGPDECFGLAWTLIHLIESSPGGTPLDAIPESDNEWIQRLRETSRPLLTRAECMDLTSSSGMRSTSLGR